MNHRERITLLAAVWVSGLACFAQPVDPPGTAARSADATVSTAAPIDLAEAIELALARNPRLRAADAGVRAATGRQQQSRVLPNPEMEAEVEDIGVSGAADGFGASTITLRVAQRLELGGKRSNRTRVAAAEVDIARVGVSAARTALVSDVKTRFAQLLAAQERARATAASGELAAKVLATVAERVRSGKVSPVELTKAEVEMAGRRVERQRAERALDAAQSSLGALWGAPPADTSELRVAGDIRQMPTLPSLEELTARLPRSPEWARGESEEQRARAQVDLERTVAVPDVTVSAGVAHGRESDDDSVQFAVSVPLPLFDRNRGNIQAALAEADQARDEREASQVALRAELAERWHEVQAALAEAQAIRDEILPGARKAFQSAEEAYRSGRTEYLDVLDAQQTLSAAELRHIDALASLHLATADIERLVGGSFIHE